VTRMEEVDLRAPVPDFHLAPHDHVQVLLRWGTIPLGTIHFKSGGGPLSLGSDWVRQEAVGAIGWPLWQAALSGRLEAAGATPPISVLVCTRDRALSLDRCLRALSALDYPDYEVVVVDSASRGPQTAEVAARHAVRYVREDRPGLDRARNRGVREARHAIVAFIDDDAMAAPGWLRGVARGFDEPGISAVTGLILPAELETPAQFEFEAYGGMGKGFKPFTVRRAGMSERQLLWSSAWGVGTNMAFRRDVFGQVGPFDPALDVGTPTGGGGDLEMLHRVVASGYGLRYEPSALIRHLHRRDRRALRRQIGNNGRAFVAYLMTVARNRTVSRASVVSFALREWGLPWIAGRLWRTARARDGKDFRLALGEAWGACTGPLGYLRSRRESGAA
jgi:glycosyltransferase involved in cell wall biosynthesis